MAKAAEQYCRALALSGGGSFGCYETGVIWGLLHYGNPEDYSWDVVTGVSAGAIQAGMISVWPKGKEVQMSEYISDLAMTMTQQNITRDWPGILPSYIEGILYHKGLIDESPLEDYLRN